MTSTQKLDREMNRLRKEMDHHAQVEEECLELRNRVAELESQLKILWQCQHGDVAGLDRPAGREYQSRSGT